ncbi:MAG TPA: aldose 1-epimerase family protein [Actinopolymorphaceae bacterium]
MSYAPSGEQYAIHDSGYSAVVTEVGATLRELRHGDRPLVAGFDASELRPLYRGALLAPWPNRISDGTYSFEGARHSVAINEPDRANALHGLVSWVPWRLVRLDGHEVSLAYRLFPQDGYPFQLDLAVTYTLSGDGLHCVLTAENSGVSAAPYGCAPHPYLVAGEGKVDDWTLELPADRYLDVTPDRLLPKSVRDVEGTRFDFRAPRRIGGTALDHAYTGFTRREVRVTAPEGTGVAIAWGESSPWLQVHTADRPEPEFDRVALAVEPMTCPPDAFTTRVDLVVLQPGDRHEATWTISAL